MQRGQETVPVAPLDTGHSHLVVSDAIKDFFELQKRLS